MEQFCPPNITFSQIWIDHGVSQCFMETISSSVIFGFIVIFGIAQLIIYRKYSTRNDFSRLRTSYLFCLQICLIFVLCFAAILRLILRWKVFDGATVYGYMVRSEKKKIRICQFLMTSFSDPLHKFYGFCIFVCNMFDIQRTILSAAISTSKRSWRCSFDILYFSIHCAKHGSDKFEP